MQLQIAENATHRDIRAKVWAAMETGQHSRARTTLIEYAEYFPVEAKDLHLDVVQTYGVTL